MITISDEFRTKLNEITELSNKINKNDKQKILNMMKEHIDEIEQRYNNDDEIRAGLTVGADGSFSRISEIAGFIYAKCLFSYGLRC